MKVSNSLSPLFGFDPYEIFDNHLFSSVSGHTEVGVTDIGKNSETVLGICNGNCVEKLEV